MQCWIKNGCTILSETLRGMFLQNVEACGNDSYDLKNYTTQTKCQYSISQKIYFFARVPQTHPHRLATILASQGTLALVKSWSLHTSYVRSVRITITFGMGKMEKTLNIRLSGMYLLLDIYLYWEQCFCFHFFLCNIDLQKCNNCQYISNNESRYSPKKRRIIAHEI